MLLPEDYSPGATYYMFLLFPDIDFKIIMRIRAFINVMLNSPEQSDFLSGNTSLEPF